MKTLLVITVSMLMLNSLSITAQQSNECAPEDNPGLFNGKDLGNWEFFLKDQSVDPATVFFVKDAAIHVSGTPFGYMRTKEEFSEYKLHLEWRWPNEATNSGVFIHTQKPDAIWPPCFEVQLMAGNAGDFICVGGATMNERTEQEKRVIPKFNPSNEVAVGEWNIMEVICKGNTIEVYINGVLQNKATGTTLTGGHICLQSEGKDIEFRNIRLVKL